MSCLLARLPFREIPLDLFRVSEYELGAASTSDQGGTVPPLEPCVMNVSYTEFTARAARCTRWVRYLECRPLCGRTRLYGYGDIAKGIRKFVRHLRREGGPLGIGWHTASSRVSTAHSAGWSLRRLRGQPNRSTDQIIVRSG